MEKIDVKGMFAVKSDDGAVLGKLLYFSLPSIHIVRDKLIQICKDSDMPVTVGPRFSDTDAFRTATSDIRDKKF